MFLHSLPMLLLVAFFLPVQVYTSQMFGVHEAEPHSRPFMVFIEKHTENGETRFCGGSLLSEDLVLTAAHCLAKSYTVYLGLHDSHYLDSKGVQKITLVQAFPHKDYNNITYENDIMLLKLGSKAKMNKNMGTIDLPDKDDRFQPKNCLISGWGRTEEQNISRKLMEVNITLIDNDSCTNKSVYCSEGDAGPSQGDSGGPLVCGDLKAYGVVSNINKPYPNDTVMYQYVKITSYRDWITSTAKQALEEN